MAHIRALTAEDLDESLRLSQFAFQYELSPQDYEERIANAKPQETLGFFIDDKLAAKATILPLRAWLSGRVLEVGGVAGVATWPEHRRQGIVGKLLVHALELMRARGQMLSFLHPFSFAFYRKFGWETYIEFKRYEIDVSQLPRFPDTGGSVERTRDVALLDRLYRAYASRYSGTLERDAAWWSRNIFAFLKGPVAVYYDDDRQPAGYVHYEVKNNELNVHELVWLNEAARRGLWRFIANHDSMLNKVKLKAPIDDVLPFLLDNPRIKQETVPYFMARVVDVEGLLSQYPFAATGEVHRLRLLVRDEHAPWNDGGFDLDVTPAGTSDARRAAAGSQDPAASCGIAELSAMLMGYHRPRTLAELGRLEADEAALDALEALLPRTTTHLMDFF